MRKTLLTAAAVLPLLTTSALAESRSYSLDSFDQIDITTGLEAVITHGQTQSVRIEASNSGILDQIELVVRNHELHAKRDVNLLDTVLSGGILNMMHNDDKATIYITLPTFSGLSASAGANVTADQMTADTVSIDASSGAQFTVDAVDAVQLVLEASSGARLTVGGVCDSLDLDISSGSRVSGSDLSCGDAHIDGSSGASASIVADGAVTGSVSSGANIRLEGTPETLNIESSSGGRVGVR